ncbi:MAG: hypothetical protein ACXIUP_10160 [Microcella sp.]
MLSAATAQSLAALLPSASSTAPPLPDWMLIFIGVMFAAAFALLVWQFARTFSERRRQDDLARVAQRFNLVIEDDVDQALDRYLVTRTRGGLVGGFLGFAIFVTVFFAGTLWAPGSLGPATGILSFALVAVVSLLGGLIGGAIGRRAAAGHTAAARLQTLSVTQLLDPVELRIARWSAIVAVPLTIAVAALSFAPWTDSDLILFIDLRWLAVLAVAGTGVLAVVPTVARAVQRLRAISGGENALAWSDALAARSVRDGLAISYVLTGGSAIIAFMSIGMTFPAEWRDASLIVLNVAAPMGLLVFLGVWAVIQVRSPERHVQRTLWPQFALNPNLDRPSQIGLGRDASVEAEQNRDAQ